MAEQSEAVTALIDRLGLDDVGLVGHSMGGAIAVLVARTLGGRVRELLAVEAILQDEPSAWTTRIASGTLEAWEAELARLQGKPHIFARGSMLRRHAGAIERIAPAILQTSARTTYLSAVSLRELAADPSTYAAFLAMDNTTYVFGDRNLDQPLYERLLDDGVSIAIVPRAGHLMMFDNPASFYGAIARGVPCRERSA
jgi:pimeloyl-ACP methyl ester carboxylesterase